MNLKYDGPLSYFAFNCNLRHYITGWGLMVLGWVIFGVFAYVAVLEMCTLGPVGTAVRRHALPALEPHPVLKVGYQQLHPRFTLLAFND